MGVEIFEQIVWQWQRQNSSHVMARFNSLGANTTGGGAASSAASSSFVSAAGGASVPSVADAASLFGGADGPTQLAVSEALTVVSASAVVRIIIIMAACCRPLSRARSARPPRPQP